MKKSELKAVVLEFSTLIESQKWARNRVNDLKNWIADMSVEDARIAVYCEIHGWLEPDQGEFATLESFIKSLES